MKLEQDGTWEDKKFINVKGKGAFGEQSMEGMIILKVFVKVYGVKV
jgi:hypothetical protein